MPLYHLTQDAQSDLIEIRRYTVQQWGDIQSKKYLSELEQTIQLLATNPRLGRLKPDIGSNVMSFPHASHVIYYVTNEPQLIVFGVLHKSMVPFNHLGDREMIS